MAVRFTNRCSGHTAYQVEQQRDEKHTQNLLPQGSGNGRGRHSLQNRYLSPQAGIGCINIDFEYVYVCGQANTRTKRTNEFSASCPAALRMQLEISSAAGRLQASMVGLGDDATLGAEPLKLRRGHDSMMLKHIRQKICMRPQGGAMPSVHVISPGPAINQCQQPRHG